MKDFEKMWKHFPQKVKNEQIDFLLNSSQDLIIHEVNKLVVFKMKSYSFWVINKESKHCSFFDTEQQAIDYCLDAYPQSFFNKQLGIFEK